MNRQSRSTCQATGETKDTSLFTRHVVDTYISGGRGPGKRDDVFRATSFARNQRFLAILSSQRAIDFKLFSPVMSRHGNENAGEKESKSVIATRDADKSLVIALGRFQALD